MKIYSKIFYHLGLYEYFMEHTWNFSNNNMQKVHSMMSQKDLKDFPLFSPETGFYEKYSLDSYHGIRKYLLKESDEDLIDARKKYRIFKFSYRFLWTAVYCGLAFSAFSHINFSNFVQNF
jgi:Male sterility protein